MAKVTVTVVTRLVLARYMFLEGDTLLFVFDLPTSLSHLLQVIKDCCWPAVVLSSPNVPTVRHQLKDPNCQARLDKTKHPEVARQPQVGHTFRSSERSSRLSPSLNNTMDFHNEYYFYNKGQLVSLHPTAHEDLRNLALRAADHLVSRNMPQEKREILVGRSALALVRDGSAAWCFDGDDGFDEWWQCQVKNTDGTFWLWDDRPRVSRVVRGWGNIKDLRSKDRWRGWKISKPSPDSIKDLHAAMKTEGWADEATAANNKEFVAWTLTESDLVRARNKRRADEMEAGECNEGQAEDAREARRMRFGS